MEKRVSRWEFLALISEAAGVDGLLGFCVSLLLEWGVGGDVVVGVLLVEVVLLVEWAFCSSSPRRERMATG